MKKLILFFVAITMITSYTLTAQVAVNTDGTDAESSAMLDVKSSDKGMLIPRMTTDQMLAISNPQEGLMVYNFDLKTLCWFNGAEWTYDSKYENCGRLEFEGQVYATVVIGSQCWMVENLATTKYNNGTNIPLVTDNSAWAALTTPGYCWYDNDSATYASTYGVLYNWYTVNTGILCPSGWHMPTDAEWITMEMFLGMTQTEADGTSLRGTDEGGKLKETGTTHWSSPNTGATNTSGFTALPGGYRFTDGTFYSVGYYGYWWSSSPINNDIAWFRRLLESSGQVVRGALNKKYGYSVRCVRD